MRYGKLQQLTIFMAALAIAAPTRAEVRIGLAAPLTGNAAWAGGDTVEGAEIAVADLNAQGGVLGERVELITVDDYCDGEQAVAAASKLLADGVVMVFGHQCSGAAIPASKLYANAGVLMVSTFATNPRLTEQGFRNVFRVVGRDDVQGEIAAELLAERWGDQPIAILHDGEAYGEGLAAETKKGLNRRGVTEAMFDEIAPEQTDYFDIIEQMKDEEIAVLYYGGYAPEAAVIIRQARSSGHDLQLVSGDGLGNEDFALIAGSAADGALMTLAPGPACRSGSGDGGGAARPPARLHCIRRGSGLGSSGRDSGHVRDRSRRRRAAQGRVRDGARPHRLRRQGRRDRLRHLRLVPVARRRLRARGTRQADEVSPWAKKLPDTSSPRTATPCC